MVNYGKKSTSFFNVDFVGFPKFHHKKTPVDLWEDPVSGGGRSRPPGPGWFPRTGSMLGKLVVQGSTPSAELGIDDPNLKNLAAEVCRKEKEVFVPSTPNAAGWTSENLKKTSSHHFFG